MKNYSAPTSPSKNKGKCSMELEHDIIEKKNITHQVTLHKFIQGEQKTTLSERLQKHVHTSRIELSSNGSPIYAISPSQKRPKGNRIRCVGLHNSMKQLFYPNRVKSTICKKSGSSKKIGIMVHMQIRHEITCIPTGKCVCGIQEGGIKRYKRSKYTDMIVDFAKHEGIEFEGCEVPICYPDGKLITWIDLLAHKTGDIHNSIKISLKTGWSLSYSRDSEGMFLRFLEDEQIKASTSNIHHLQSLCEDIILESEYEEKSLESYTLYVYKHREENEMSIFEPGSKKAKTTYHYKKSEYPDWCRNPRIKSKIKKLLSWTPELQMENESTNKCVNIVDLS